MRYKRKLIVISVLVVLLTVLQYVLPAHSKVVNFYDAFIFRPFQSVRNMVFSIFPFSIGDFAYMLAGILLVYLIFKWIYYILQFGKKREKLGHSFLQTLIVLGFVYIFFMLGWGGNYYK